MSKTLANRLKCVIHKLIFLNQYAFICDCMIIDNYFMAFETIYNLKDRIRGQNGHKLIFPKIDIVKGSIGSDMEIKLNLLLLQ